MKFEENKFLKIVRYTTLWLFIFSLTQKSYCMEGDCGTFGGGFLCLFFGWIALLFLGVNYISWLANPLLIIAWLSLKQVSIVSIICSGLAIILCFSFLSVPELLRDEGGNWAPITGYHLGYWLWAASMIILFIGGLFIEIARRIRIA